MTPEGSWRARWSRSVLSALCAAALVTSRAEAAAPSPDAALAARHDPSRAVRAAAAGDVSSHARDWLKSGAVTTPVLLDALADWLRTEDDGWALHEIRLALVLLEDEVPATWWAPFIDHPDPGVRAAAARGVSPALTPEIEARLMRLDLAERFDWVRAARVAALWHGTSESSRDALHAALSDPSPDVRGAASVALRWRADRTSAPFLLRAMPDPALQGAESPAAALGRTHDPAALPALVRAATSDSWRVRKLAAVGLGWFGGPDVIPALARLLVDAVEVVRSEAARALADIGSVPATLELLRCLAELPGEVTFDGGRARAPQGAENQLHAASRLSDEALLAAADAAETSGAMAPALASRVSALARSLAEYAGGFTVMWSTGDLHASLYDVRNVSSRVVAPRGAYAEGWEMAIGREHGGERTWLRRGRTVTAWDHAVVDGQEWVEAHDGPYTSAWVRAEDLRLPRSYRPRPHASPSGSSRLPHGRSATVK